MLEFTNKVMSVEKTLRHAFRKQASLCNEYLLYGTFIIKKYPDLKLGLSFNLITEHSSVFANAQKFEKQLRSTLLTVTDREIELLLIKHRRMKNAKLLFERLNGDYKNY